MVNVHTSTIKINRMQEKCHTCMLWGYKWVRAGLFHPSKWSCKTLLVAGDGAHLVDDHVFLRNEQQMNKSEGGSQHQAVKLKWKKPLSFLNPM